LDYFRLWATSVAFIRFFPNTTIACRPFGQGRRPDNRLLAPELAAGIVRVKSALEILVGQSARPRRAAIAPMLLRQGPIVEIPVVKAEPYKVISHNRNFWCVFRRCE
jgi:hypothetical protein